MFRVAFLLLSLLGLSAVAGEKEPAQEKLITPAAQRAAQRGLQYLARQQRDDGGFGSGPLSGNPAVCAISATAMLAAGSTPGRGPYGTQVNRCIDYLLAAAQPSGFIAGPEPNTGPMYGHGFATMFLAESYGMSPRPELREKLAKAVNIIINSQNKQGGWRYQPVRADADVSVTVCQIMALRAARNAGLFVPNETVDRAVEYVRQSQNADGGFSYMLPRSESAFPRSAAAVAALFSAGIYKGPEISKGLDYLMQPPAAKEAKAGESYFYYGQYYAAQAFWLSGPERFNKWFPAVRDELVRRQRDDGAWPDSTSNECATAMACIVLQMPNDLLPIFQR
jgi:hypothetical protein